MAFGFSSIPTTPSSIPLNPYFEKEENDEHEEAGSNADCHIQIELLRVP